MSNFIRLSPDCLYYPDKFLGKGQFGHVFEGAFTNHQVAVKVINKKVLKAKGGKNMLDYELNTYKLKIDHPNVLKFYAHYENRENDYIVLELVKGKDL